MNALPEAGIQAVTSHDGFFPMGWFDGLETPQRLQGMRSAGMNAVLPYTGDSVGRVKAYLDQARSRGMKVFVEIDPVAVSTLNPVLVRSFVEMYKNHPSVYGWLLADEPTLDPRFRLLTPGLAKTLYQQVKQADSKRPVGIVFGVTEDPRRWVGAMDVLLYDDYVQDAGKPEFFGLWQWRKRLEDRAKIAAKVDGYIPILQAFGQDAKGIPHKTKRLPTVNEMRYITYSAIQHNATGLFFWVRYRSRSYWINDVLTPISREVAPALRAVGAGQVRGAKVVAGKSMRSRLFRDPKTKTLWLVLVHDVSGTVKAKVQIDRALKMNRISTRGKSFDISDGKFEDDFGSYAARLYRLSS